MKPILRRGSAGLMLVCLASGILLAAPACCSSAELQRLLLRTLEHGGRRRTYYIYLPRSLEKAKPVPLLFVLHGGGGAAEGMEYGLTRRGFDWLAERDGFIAVYPQGVERQWNDGRSLPLSRAVDMSRVDDVGFFAAMADALSGEFSIDRARIYATGISNGGLMSLRLAGERADLFAAIAAVTASLSRSLLAHYAPSRPVSVLIMNGTEDPLVPYGGGTIVGPLGRVERGEVVSTADTVVWWVRRNHCAAEPRVTMLPDAAADDGTRVQRALYRGGDHGSEVALYTVIGGGHTWPGGPQYLPPRLVGRVCRDIDANEVIWDFFKRHRRNGG